LISERSEEENEERSSGDERGKVRRMKKNGVRSLSVIGCFDIGAVKAIFPSFALIGKEARRVFAIDVDVAKHNFCTVSCQVIDLISKRASKLLESLTAHLGWVLGSLALAC